MTLPPLPESVVPRLAAGVKFRFDNVRQVWIVLAPERLFLPDEHAVAVLSCVDGSATLGGIIDDLAARFQAPRTVIAADVTTLLQDLAARGALRW